MDFEPGEFVKRVGLKRTGFIESIDGDHATICFGKDTREIWPLSFLKKLRGGDKFDSRN